MLNLVADIGGTNSRFAVCESGNIELQEPRKYPNREFPSLLDVITHYLSETGLSITGACLAVAGPTHHETIQLTNIDWSFSKAELGEAFSLTRLEVTNDFTALAMSVPYLKPEHLRQIGTGAAQVDQPVAVLGPGTGLGVSGLLPHGKAWIAIQGEGGNTGFTPANDLEIELLKRAQQDKSFVRAEDFISGNGLSYLHGLLCEINGKPGEPIAAKDITWRAKTSDCDRCRHTVEVFCGMLGSFAGDLAMTLGALGGTYIGGGVAPQLDDLFDKSPFRQRFEAKGLFHDYVKPIPTYLMLSHSRNALIGAAAILAQSSPES